MRRSPEGRDAEERSAMVMWVVTWIVLVVQASMLLVLLYRMAPGRTRRPPVEPAEPDTTHAHTVSVIVATLNEAHRITPCLDGLRQQSPTLREVLVVDSNSTDDTRAIVAHAATRDARVRLIPDDDPPPDWIGKVWALDLGLRAATGEWVLGIDADTEPEPGLVDAVVQAAERDALDVVSFSPRFAAQGAAERFVQPAMLTTLLYRCGAVGASPPPAHRVLANGQCFLARRSVLIAHGGYAVARDSFSDDVTLARALAARGVRVSFLDGSRIIRVRAYASLGEMWREWGRSFDLKDSTPYWQRWLDVTLVWSVQALPLPVLVAATWWRLTSTNAEWPVEAVALVVISVLALAIRLSVLWQLRGSYAVRGVPFWLSFLADVAAAWRLTHSTLRRPRKWRGRAYATR